MTDEEGFDNHASMIHAGTFTTTCVILNAHHNLPLLKARVENNEKLHRGSLGIHIQQFSQIAQ
jgi:hypothetical protein